jgi:hypothetical protein
MISSRPPIATPKMKQRLQASDLRLQEIDQPVGLLFLKPVA